MTFLDHLKNGFLSPLLERAKLDETLLLAPRGDAFNLYYRGGLLMGVAATARGICKARFDRRYDKAGTVPPLPDRLLDEADVRSWLDAFPAIKQAMDATFARTRKMEREFQQLVARENNRSPISKETEYFIADLEVPVVGAGARLDMLALKWLAKDRGFSDRCRMALVEMKFGDNALDGSAGLAKHLSDCAVILADPARRESLRAAAEEQFNALLQLGLLQFNLNRRGERIRIVDDRPEVIFLLANHNPRSDRLAHILDELSRADADGRLTRSPHFDLRFHVSTYAGYGMHDACMLDFERFRRLADGG